MRSSRRRFRFHDLQSNFTIPHIDDFSDIGAGDPEQESQSAVDVHNRGSHQSSGDCRL